MIASSPRNSTTNPSNPDTKRRVKWGLQSHEEMFMGFMNVAEIPQIAGGTRDALR